MAIQRERERRAARRISFTRPVAVVDSLGERFPARSFDFSLHGLGLSTNHPFKVGEILQLTLNIAPAGKVHVLSVRGEIVHREYQARRFHLGVRFYKNQ